MTSLTYRYVALTDTGLRRPANQDSGYASNRLLVIADGMGGAAAGDLEARITGMGTRSDFGKMCQAINATLDMADSFVREASAAMEHCSNDRFHRPILLRGLKGAYHRQCIGCHERQLKPATAPTVAAMAVEMTATHNPISTDFCMPRNVIANRSWPRALVPNQWVGLGGCCSE